MRLDPLAISVKTALISVLFYARRYAEALDAAHDLVGIEPASVLAHFFAGQILTELDDATGAREALQRAVTHSGQSSETLAALGHALARAGDTEGARQILLQLQQRGASRYVSLSHFALIHAGLGEHDRALDFLEAARDARASDLIWLGVRPGWDALRQDPRFRSVTTALRLDSEYSAR
jgi:tetratricopeptide (TPR) repeat protein